MMMIMAGREGLRAFAGLAGLVLVAALVAGCGGGDPRPNLSSVAPTVTGSSGVGLPGSGADSSSVSVSVSVSASGSPTVAPVRGYPADVPLTGHNVRPGERPPVFPAAAGVRSQAGADAFAEFFMRTLDWMYATTNPAYPKHYFGPTCGLCAGLTTGMAKTAALHHWYIGDRLVVDPAEPTAIAPVEAPADYCSMVVVDASASRVVDTTGKVFSSDRAYDRATFKLCVKYGSGSWRTTYLARP